MEEMDQMTHVRMRSLCRLFQGQTITWLRSHQKCSSLLKEVLGEKGGEAYKRNANGLRKANLQMDWEPEEIDWKRLLWTTLRRRTLCVSDSLQPTFKWGDCGWLIHYLFIYPSFHSSAPTLPLSLCKSVCLSVHTTYLNSSLKSWPPTLQQPILVYWKYAVYYVSVHKQYL